MTDYLSEGQIVKVKVLETDEKGRVKLSMKALLERPVGMPEERHERSDRGERPPRRDRDDRPPRRDRDDRPRRDAAPAEGANDAPTAAPHDEAPKQPE